MTDTKKAERHPEDLLWEQLDDVRAGMLGVEGSHDHMQPMTHQIDRENGKLWFFSSRATDLVRQLGTKGQMAHFCIISKPQDFHACIAGRLVENKDQEKVDAYWSDVVAAWFKDKNDPDMTLLEFGLDNAAIWASTRNPVKFAWEIQRSKNSDRMPDVGSHKEVPLS